MSRIEIDLEFRSDTLESPGSTIDLLWPQTFKTSVLRFTKLS